MNISEIFDEKTSTDYWADDYKIPWDEPGFSKRMLDEHLSQDHDLASRKFKIIDNHVDWLHNEILQKKKSHILDLCCGPGFYMERLAELGHTSRGIDFSPASIKYAQDQTKHSDRCEFIHGDICKVEYGNGYDLATIIYGEFNVFPVHDVSKFLKKAFNALKPGGQVIIEAHNYETIKSIGVAGNSWYKAPSGLFSEKPHICLTTSKWDDAEKVAEMEFYVIDAESSEVAKYRNTMQAYTNDQYSDLLKETGFSEVVLLPAWGKKEFEDSDNHLLLRGWK
jgi:ubiquinone/menaquinone biosynthesis C-methylase UbiE